jgi:hypothetical protein
MATYASLLSPSGGLRRAEQTAQVLVLRTVIPIGVQDELRVWHVLLENERVHGINASTNCIGVV